MKNLDKKYSIRIKKTMYDDIEKIAEETDQKPTDLIRQFIKEGIEKYKKQK